MLRPLCLSDTVSVLPKPLCSQSSLHCIALADVVGKRGLVLVSLRCLVLAAKLEIHNRSMQSTQD